MLSHFPLTTDWQPFVIRPGVLALIEDPAVSEKLQRLIPAPDFPTGGEIMGLEGPQKLYATGASETGDMWVRWMRRL